MDTTYIIQNEKGLRKYLDKDGKEGHAVKSLRFDKGPWEDEIAML